MASKLYVGNLSYDTRDDDLQELFSEYGQVVSAKVIMDRDTGRPRGFGFVEMGTQEEAQKAISELDGKDFMGRAIKVNMAQPREDRPRAGRGGGGGRDRW